MNTKFSQFNPMMMHDVEAPAVTAPSPRRRPRRPLPDATVLDALPPLPHPKPAAPGRETAPRFDGRWSSNPDLTPTTFDPFQFEPISAIYQLDDDEADTLVREESPSRPAIAARRVRRGIPLTSSGVRSVREREPREDAIPELADTLEPEEDAVAEKAGSVNQEEVLPLFPAGLRVESCSTFVCTRIRLGLVVGSSFLFGVFLALAVAYSPFQ